MLDMDFDSRGDGVKDFRVKVEEFATGGAIVRLDFWVFTEEQAWNPQAKLYLTTEQAKELFDQLYDYLLS
jgi:hypothetical protein